MLTHLARLEILTVTQYGVNSVAIMASVGGVYLNFGIWAVSLIPAWLVVGNIGVTSEDDEEIVDEGVESHLPVELSSGGKT